MPTYTEELRTEIANHGLKDAIRDRLNKVNCITIAKVNHRMYAQDVEYIQVQINEVLDLVDVTTGMIREELTRDDD